MLVNEWYSVCALVTCFEGDDTEVVPDPPVAPKEEDIKPPEGFTQDQQKKFNDAVAAERRKQEQKYRKELEKTETTYKELLSNSKSLTEKERMTLQENLEAVQGQLRSKEQQTLIEKKELEAAYQGKLTVAERRAEIAETRWRESTITRALQDAAIEHEAYSPSQVVTLLKGMTKLVEQLDEKTNKPNGQFKVVVEFPDKDATTGQEIMTSKTTAEAVKRMTEIQEFQNLFRRNIVSGIGGNSAIGGLTPGSNGKIDPKSLTTEQWMKARSENPELIGLGRKRRR